MKDKIEFYCVTCKKKLTCKQAEKHNSITHEIRCRGFLTMNAKQLNVDSVIKGFVNNAPVRTGIALEDAKAGEKVHVRL